MRQRNWRLLMINLWKRITLSLIVLVSIMIPFQSADAETLEDQLNNLIGPNKQYDTHLSPVYLKTNSTEEYINQQSGELTITQPDYVLPGRNGLDLEIKRIYKGGISNVKEMKVKYVNGAWVDYVHSDTETSSFYEDRYNIGIGMRFSFPSMEIRENSDETSHRFLHTESGDVYRLKPYTVDGELNYFVQGQTIKDIVVKESNSFNNGQSDGTSKYVMSRNNGEKNYFAEDGRILGIVDRYGNTITFEYQTLQYTIDGTTIKKRLISTITDTIGRTVTIEYKEDHTFTVGSIEEQNYSASESYKASQNPNNTDSGDLKGKFQVIVHLPGSKKIVYDKSAVLVNDSKHVIRTRLQRVFDVDNKPKYHFWYEQTDLGFTYTNGTDYSVYNRYENLVQIDYVKTNKIKRYTYNTYTKALNKGSMQYRKIFDQQDIVKEGYDSTQPKFMDRFVTQIKDKANYVYTNESDGFGFEGYKSYDDYYLENTYRYFTKVTDSNGSTTEYTYDGIHQLMKTQNKGADHQEVITTERDEMKLLKKKERLIYPIENGSVVGDPVHKIENFRYDEYGNLTNYTGPEANRDESGYPINDEHTVIYSYAYDKYHVPTTKTWKKDEDTTSQVINTVDSEGNIIKKVQVNTQDKDNWIVTDYQYDQYGNMTKKEIKSSQSFITHYEYGVDINGVDHKGAYLTREYGNVNDQQVATQYAYDHQTGNLTTEMDPNENKTTYQYDVLNRVKKVIQPDGSIKQYQYIDEPFTNLQVKYTDSEESSFMYEYDIMGGLVKASVWQNELWNVLKTTEYDAKGNKVKETDSNGHSIRFEYDSQYRLVKKTRFEQDTVNKGSVTLNYKTGYSDSTPFLVTITDEAGFIKKYHYDILNRLIEVEATPDNEQFFTVTHTYDYVGNKRSTTDALGNTTQFEYDDLGRMIKKIDALGYETEFSYNALNKARLKKEPGGKVTETKYDALGRMSEQRIYKQGSNDYVYTAYTFDPAGNVSNIERGQLKNGADRLSMDVRYTYDEMNRQTDEYKKIDNTRTAHTHYSYDLNGNLTQEIDYANSSETKYRIYMYDHDYAGRVIEEQGVYREEGSSTATEHGSYHKQYAYDFAGNLNEEKVWNGNNFDTTTYKYDYRNKLIEKIVPYLDKTFKTTTYKYDKVGNLVVQTLFILGMATTSAYAHDGLGRKVSTTDPLGNTTRILYDENGNQIKVIDPRYYSMSIEEAPGIEYEYDPLNRRVKSIAYDGSNREVVEYTEYDGRGNIVKVADGFGYDSYQPSESYGEVYEYDVLDHVVTYISAQTMAENKQYGTEFYTKRTTYDALGNVLTETDPQGHVTSHLYYLNGRLKETVYPDGTNELYDYDLTGNALTEKIDRKGYVTRMYNNIFNQPYRMEYPDGTFETFVYSPKGEVEEKRDQGGNITTFDYNRAGNLIGQKEYIRTDDTYTYYKLVKKQVDEANRVINRETFLQKVPKQSGLSIETVSSGDKVQYVYDNAGRKLQVLGPNGRETIYEYDRAGNRVTEKKKVKDGNYDVQRFTYDFRSRLTSESVLVRTSALEIRYLTGAEYDDTYYDRVLSTTSYDYYANNQLKSKTDPQGNVTRYEYDYNKRLTKKIDPLLAATVYQYDLKGNLAEQINAKGASTYFEYDEMNQLIRQKAPAADGGLAITRYVYDEMGNLVKQITPNDYESEKDTPSMVLTMLGTSYKYDEMNRRIKTIAPSGEGMEYIAYDELGRVEKIVDGLRFTGDMATSPGTVYNYDGLGRVVQQTNTLGYSTAYAYDVLGNLTKETDARINVTKYKYYPDQTLEKVTYTDGGTVSYTYDKLGRKTSETDQRGHTTTYTYNAFGNVREIIDPYQYTREFKYDLNGNEVSRKDKRGSVSWFRYDANNRLIEKKTPLRYDGSNNVVYAVQTYVYDQLGNISRTTTTDSKDPSFKRETRYTYYANNLLQTVSGNSGAYAKHTYDKNGNRIKTETLRESGIYDIERYEYDVLNRLTKRIQLVDETDIYQTQNFTNLENLRDAEYPGKIQIITGYEYDVLGNKTKEIRPRAYQYTSDDTVNRQTYTTTYTYDTLNRLDKMTHYHNGVNVYKQYSYDEVGNLIVVQDERGYETRYTYDSMNRVKTETDAEGNTLTYAYDLSGNQTAQTNAKQHTMTYQYDKLNRLVMIKDAYEVVIRKNIYDVNGNVIKVMDAKGYLSASTDEARYGTEYSFDLANRLSGMIDPEIAEKAPGKYTFRYEYNSIGQKTKETDALGNITQYEYDDAGRLIRVIDPLGVETTYAYDKAGNKLYMVNGRGKATRYRYGAFGLLKEVINAKGESMKYRYDLGLNVALKIDRKGNHTEYTYDHRNLLLSKNVVETGDRIRYEYDAVGNRTKMIDESGTRTFTYDKNNQVLTIEKDGGTEISYTYDDIGNIETVMDQKGFTTTYTYDKSNRMKTVTFEGQTTTYSYDKNGNRESILYEGGVREEYTYDKNNRLLTLTNKKPYGSIISEYSYTYDFVGRQDSKTDSFGTTTYVYDPAGRITRVEAPGKTSVYTYDDTGNRQTLSETYTSPQPSGYVDPVSQQPVEYMIKKSEYFYSDTNELLELVEKLYDDTGKEVMEKTTSYLYDANGNEIRQKVSYIQPHSTEKYQFTTGNPYGNQEDHPISNMIEKVSNTYDGFNRLKKVDKIRDGERVTVEYTYNGDGLRTQKAVKSSKEGYTPKVTNYIYDRQHVILETDGASNLKTRYVRGLNYIARYSSANQLSYYLYNGHGDVVQTVSETGEVQNQYDYDIFGNPILTVEVYENAIRYAGEFYDAETGLYYLRARYYDPYTGRFISEDSYWGEDSNPLSLNLYTYAYNNPIIYVDPSGHFPGLSNLIGLGKKIWGSISGGRDDEESKEEPQESANNVKSSSDVPAWLDWDGDGVVDSREDMDEFDKNNDRVADWLQDDTDQDWVYNSESGWDQNNGNSNPNSGPTAEDIREAYDYAASKMSNGSQSYTSAGIPNYDTFDKIAERLSGFDSSDRMSKNSNSNKSNTVRISAMQMHATDGGAGYGDDYYDTYMSIHAEEYFAAKKREEILQQFPESYREALSKLLEEHPNWTFEAYEVPVTWEEFIDAQDYRSTNLIHTNYPASYSEFDPNNQDSWSPPVRQVIEYYADPRNFLDSEKDLFQFLQLKYDMDSETLDGVESILKNTVHLEYSETIMKAAEESSVSAYYLAAKLAAEAGHDGNPLTRGSVEYYEGYYNPYNFDAWGASDKEVLQKGGQYAKKQGWNSMEKGIIGGANKLGEEWIQIGQDTIYTQKFDFIDPYFNHQYMQNIAVAALEGPKLYNVYQEQNALDANLVFKIPVFKDLPSERATLPE
jgi:RHS repeat-associated protein